MTEVHHQNLFKSTGFLEKLACIVGFSIFLGLLFLIIGSLLGLVGWSTHDLLDYFLVGMGCGFFGSLIGVSLCGD
jgi:hypothetical protein